MLQNRIVFIYFLGVFGGIESMECDKSTVSLKEGNIGENGNLPWLGVLRVHIHKATMFKTAVTGILLVKSNYAIANSGDVNKVSMHVLKTDSKAMFITTDNKPVYCGIRDVMTHPEYEYETYNSIAIIELQVDRVSEKYRNLKPICWPSYLFNASTNLYALGFTDENKLLEKAIYKMQYVSLSLCEEFYNRVDSARGTLPQYQCAYAANNSDNCVWDNGMVLASNTTGFWTMIGFGVRGPGCAAPARFIDVFQYLTWIRAATDLIEARYM